MRFYLSTVSVRHSRRSKLSLGITRLLRITAHDLDFVGGDIALIVKLEGDILDKKGPDIVAEAICIQVTLQVLQSAHTAEPNHQTQGYLEVQSSLHFICQHFGDGLVESRNDFHRSLRFEAT